MKNIAKLFGVSIVTLSLFASHAYAQLGATIDGAVNTAVNTTVDTDINTGVDVNLDTSSDSDVNNNTEINTDVSLKVNTFGIAIKSSSQVNSEEDLKVFSSNISLQSKVIARVDISSENTSSTKVEVVYRHNGRFLGFIPVTIKSTTVVEAQENAEAKISSNLSWWSFLVSGENYDGATLESHIKNNTRIQANAKVSASAQARAQIAEAVIAELKANAAVQASANVK